MQTGTIGATGITKLGDGSPSQTAFMLIQLSGTFVATVEFEGTVDGTNYTDLSALAVGDLYNPPATAVVSATAPGIWRIDVAGLKGVQLNCSAYTSGTVSYAVTAVIG